MEARKRLDDLLKVRGVALAREKARGTKIVGYYPDEYFPEELALACGAIPIGLCRGGEYAPVFRSGGYVIRWLDTFCRAQIGYLTGKDDLYYAMLDLYVSPIVDKNMQVVADCVSFFTDIEEFRFGVPREKNELGYKYYLYGLRLLKEKLESLTGNKITDDKLKESIQLCNRERELLKEISLMRKVDSVPLSGKEFLTLNHASYVLDKKAVVDILESYSEELKKAEGRAKGPRIILTGSTLAWGDYKLIDMAEKAGANVVIEQYCEAVRDYWDNVDVDGDLMEGIARRYFTKKVPHMAFVPGRERLELVIKLAKDFKVDGGLWYGPMYRDEADIEFAWFEEWWKDEMGLPILRLETEYDPYEAYEAGPLKTRVETFVETMRQ